VAATSSKDDPPSDAPDAEAPPSKVHHLPPAAPAKRLLQPRLPIGVAVMAALVAVAAIILIVTGALVLLNAYLGQTVIPSDLLISSTIDTFGAAILLVVGAALIALARGLWDQELWALAVTVGILFAALAYEFFTASLTVLFVIALLLFIYLLAVRHHFY
jgi:hypothetical protein